MFVRRLPLVGTRYTCKNCNEDKYVYFGCGNSRCPKCQGIKRIQWQDKLSNKTLKVPYQHIVFTMPHQLNSLARVNAKQLYNCLFRSAWSALSTCAKEERNLGALPGAIMVLHTFGSDLKYHVHVHALVTFGGLSKDGKWRWPKRKNKIVPYRQIRSTFRKEFLSRLSTLYPNLHIKIPFVQLREELMKKQWCVHAEPPTANTITIEQYLGKYMCRTALSKNRFHYDAVHRLVTLFYKDYKNQKDHNSPPPIASKYLHPLTTINQIMAHCLPLYFQKCRYYGIHASAAKKKYEDSIPKDLQKIGSTVRYCFSNYT